MSKQRLKRLSKSNLLVTHMFDHPDVVDFTDSVLEKWQPSGKPILFVPCAKTKPIQESRSHKQMFHAFQKVCDLLILSEPLTIVPYDRLDYPYYEYPPSALRRIEGELEKFKNRLTEFLSQKNLNQYDCNFLLPQHHLLILWRAWKRAFGDITDLKGYSYSRATRWFFIKKLKQQFGILDV